MEHGLSRAIGDWHGHFDYGVIGRLRTPVVSLRKLERPQIALEFCGRRDKSIGDECHLKLFWRHRW